jgi:hypothetical protein
MKIWKQDTQTPSHRLVKLHCEQHSDYDYLGDFNDAEIKTFFLEIQPDMDIEKNLKLLNYYGYLHLFIVKK